MNILRVNRSNKNVSIANIRTRMAIIDQLYGMRYRYVIEFENLFQKLTAELKGKGKGSLYIFQYPVRGTAQSVVQLLPSLADLLIPTPTRLLREAL